MANDPELCRAVNETDPITSVLNPPLDVLVSAALTLDAEEAPPPRYGRHLAAALHAALTR